MQCVLCDDAMAPESPHLVLCDVILELGEEHDDFLLANRLQRGFHSFLYYGRMHPDGWMVGCSDGWIDGWSDGWMVGWLDGWLVILLDG